MSIQRIAVFYGHVASNLGDLAINVGSLALLRKAFPGAAVSFFALHANEDTNFEKAQIETLSVADSSWHNFRTSHNHILKIISQPEHLLNLCGCTDADLIVIASGEHFFSYNQNENPRSLYWRLLPILAAKRLRKKVLVMPSTFGPFETQDSRALMKQILMLPDGVAARESYSSAFLEEMLDQEITELPDPAFFLEPPDENGVNKPSSGVLGLVMRSPYKGIRLGKNMISEFSSQPKEEDPAFRFSVKAIENFLSRSLRREARLFVQTEADRELAESICAYFSSSKFSGRVSVIIPINVEGYLAELGAVQYLISSRFHAQIFSLLVKTPVYGVYFSEHGNKIPGLFAWLGLPEFCAEIDENVDEVAVNCVRILTRENFDWDTCLKRVRDGREKFYDWIKKSTRKSGHVAVTTYLEASMAMNRLGASLIKTGFEAQQANRLAKNKAEISKIKEPIEELTAGLVEFKSSISENLSILTSATSDKEVAERAIAAKLDEVLRGHQWLMEKKVKLEQEFAALDAEFKKKYRSTRSQLNDLQKENERLKNEAEANESAFVDLKQDLVCLAANLADKDTVIEALGTANQEVSEANSVLSEQLHRKQIELQKREVELEKLGTANQEVSEANSVLSEQLHREQIELQERKKAHAALGKKYASVHDQLIRVLQSKSYSFAAEIARTYRSPSGIFSLPLRLFRLRKEVNRRGKYSGILRSEFEPSSSNTGEDGSKKDWQQSATTLVEKSRSLSELGNHDKAVELALRARSLLLSELTLTTLFSAHQAAGNLEEAYLVFQESEKFLGKELTKNQEKRFKRLRSQPAIQLGLRDIMPATAAGCSYTPVRNRIAYVLHNSLPYSSGGYATRAHGLSMGLLRQGIEVFSFTRPGYPLDVSKYGSGQVKDREFIDGVLYLRTFEPSRKKLQSLDYVPAAKQAYVEHFMQHRPEMVVAASNYLCALPAMYAARELGIPFIYEVRGFWEITRLSRDPSFATHPSYKIQETMEAFVCSNANSVLTLTAAMKKELIKRGVSEESITLVPNACEPDLFLPQTRDEALASRLGIPRGIPVIGYIGTFVDYEGLEDLAAACGILKKRNVEFRLLLVGNENVSGADEGPITKALRNIAHDCKFKDWLIMPGRIPHDLVASYYSLIDIAPFPRKPWPVCEMVSPMKPLEAMAMEKCVVVSSVSALEEMVGQGQFGVVFEKGSVESLAEVLTETISDSDFRRSIGQAGREYVLCNRTWSKSAEIFAGILSENGFKS